MGGFVQGMTDTFTSLVGGKTSAEKSAEKAVKKQQKELTAIQTEQTANLEERKKRMMRKQAGRSSLLSGSELGIQSDDTKQTLG